MQAVRAATEFDWTWTLDDVPRFADLVGWQFTQHNNQRVTLTTNLDVNRTDASVSIAPWTKPGQSPQLNRISFYVTDVVLDDPTVAPELTETFDEMSRHIWAGLGTPTMRRTGPAPDRRWDLPKVVVQLSASDAAVHIIIVNPADDMWLESPDDEELYFEMDDD
ncbi:DUF6301 family protein [Nocardia sp. IFM 10818]